MVIIMKTAKFLKKLLACTMAVGLTAAMTGALSAGAAATEYQLYEMAVTDMPLGSYDTNQAADAADGVPNVKDCQAASLAQDYAMMDGNGLHGSIVEVYDTITVTSLGKVFMDTTSLSAARTTDNENPRPAGKNSGEHLVEMYRVDGVKAQSMGTLKQQKIADRSNWEKVASVKVNMDWSQQSGGFCWAELETPVTLETGLYLVVTEQKDQLRGDHVNFAVIPPQNNPEAYALAAYTGTVISASYTGDTCDQVDAATGMIYGGANFKFVKGEYTGSGSETGGETGEKPSGGNDDITQTGVGAPVAAAMLCVVTAGLLVLCVAGRRSRTH